jgi:hypothetical protein
MTYRPTQLERAFILAATGRMTNITDLRTALRSEGYPNDGQLNSSTVLRQLSKLIAASKGRPVE